MTLILSLQPNAITIVFSSLTIMRFFFTECENAIKLFLEALLTVRYQISSAHSKWTNISSPIHKPQFWCRWLPIFHKYWQKSAGRVFHPDLHQACLRWEDLASHDILRENKFSYKGSSKCLLLYHGRQHLLIWKIEYFYAPGQKPWRSLPYRGIAAFLWPFVSLLIVVGWINYHLSYYL